MSGFKHLYGPWFIGTASYSTPCGWCGEWLVTGKTILYHKKNQKGVHQMCHRIIRASKRADKYGVLNTLKVEEWLALLEKYDGGCARCGSKENVHLDHVIPLSRGGDHSIENVQPLCRKHNLQKGTKTEDWR